MLSVHSLWSIHLEVATTSTSANLLLSEEMLLLAAKWVSLLPAGLDVSGAPKLCRRRKTRVGGVLSKACFCATKLCLPVISEGRVPAGRTAVYLLVQAEGG